MDSFRLFPRIGMGAVFVCTVTQGLGETTSDLSIQDNNYPKSFFFRFSEQAQNEKKYPTYESWEKEFDRLQGIMGKCLEEECLGREKRNPTFFSHFKERHPEQVVLLHFNGNSRDPRYHTENYFPGHWIYRQAAAITKDVPAEAGQSCIHVESVADFQVNMGRYGTSNDDVALFALKDDGKHDWYHCEQVRLLSVDVDNKTIRVERACYGTQPLAFEKGRSRAAAHQSEGPWGKTNNLLWYYNHSAHCPRDRNGHTCADLLVEDLAEWFSPSGILGAFDGLEFDVLFNETHGDTDGDGKTDHGVIDGLNQYGIGVVEFVRKLRLRMGDPFIIMGDGALGWGGQRSQRAWGLLNGIESEGWPNLNDWEFEDWSGGLNRHFFWAQNGRSPVFNYVNHKYIQRVPGQPGVIRHPEVPFSSHRLVLAACQFFDAKTCFSFPPPADPDGKLGVWDELRCGKENRLGWLGKPEAPPVRLAMKTPDLLSGQGKGRGLAGRIEGQVKTSVTRKGVLIEPVTPCADRLRFIVEGLPTKGQDLTVFVEMKGDPMERYPREMARFAEVTLSGGMVDLMAQTPVETGMKLRGGSAEIPLDRASGAGIHRRPASMSGKTLESYFVHPPYKEGTGYAFWCAEGKVPEGGELRFSVGMGEKSPERSDGVWFKVYASLLSEGVPGEYKKLFEISTKEHRWIPQVVSLTAYAEESVRLKFVADCGPRDDCTTDHAYWGDVKLVSEEADENQVTQSKRTMTWVNEHSFESSFTYRQIRSNTVQLAMSIEGRAPLHLKRISAHAHPDAIFRVFEKGLVLANPSRQPYSFDLKTISPGRTYRRLKATDNQDTVTNNGQPVGDSVTLAERDALFLVRDDQRR